MEFIYNISQRSQRFNYQAIIDYISSHFYLIKETELLKIPKSILYSIISNSNLIINSEDSFFELFQKIFYAESHQNFNNDIGIILFYEEIDFINLSESKFTEFLDVFDFNKMTDSLWIKLCCCFYVNFNTNRYKKPIECYFYEGAFFDYDGSEMNRFKGIIHYLTEKKGGNVNDNKTVIVTSFSSFNCRYSKYAVDLEDNSHYFQSCSGPNSWLKYDFGETRHDCGYHLKN